MRQLSTADVVDDIRYLKKFDDNSASEIYSCHGLQALGRYDYKDALKNWHRVLRPGGKLWVCVPDFEAVAERYVRRKRKSISLALHELIGLLYSRQDYKENHGGMTWDFDTLGFDLLSVGFVNVARFDWRAGPNPDTFDYSKAYLPKGERETGTLMSLNVEAIKP